MNVRSCARLGEVGLGGGLDAVGVVAEEHRVEVAGHDVLFRHLVLEHAGVVHLQQLVAAVAFEPGEEVVLGHLHRDRRGTLLGRIGGEVRQRRSHQAAHVDAVVGEELLVLDHQERIDHRLRDVLVGDRLRVLELVERDLLAVDVVDVGALGERLELGQHDGQFFVGVRRRPHARCDADHRGREQQRAGGHDEQQSGNEAEHNAQCPQRYCR